MKVEVGGEVFLSLLKMMVVPLVVTSVMTGILGLGETVGDRLKMLEVLSELDPQPTSVPINRLVPIPGTPLEGEGHERQAGLRVCSPGHHKRVERRWPWNLVGCRR